jgi:hypothetical protein
MSEAARILLVVTGKMEEVALGDALHRVFPSAYFGVTRTQGFTATSPRLRMPAPEYDESRAQEIVEDLLAAAIPREPGARPYDYAVAVEDVELINEADESDAGTRDADEGIRCILEHVKLGVDVVLRHEEQKTIVFPKGKAKRAPSVATDEDRRRFLRERCSFHLLRPLAEALFFGERAALDRAAGGAALPPVHFDPATRDIELFETVDPAYLAKRLGDARWAKQNRRRHPKHYLEYLLDPAGTAPRPYKEVEHGKRALATLDWQAVVAPPVHAQMVRALLDDVADMLGAPLPWCAAGAFHPLTQRRRGGRLRNVV